MTPNPNHYEALNQASREKATRTLRKNGKISERDIQIIYARQANPQGKLIDIAKEFGCSVGHVGRLLRSRRPDLSPRFCKVKKTKEPKQPKQPKEPKPPKKVIPSRSELLARIEELESRVESLEQTRRNPVGYGLP